MRDDGRRAYASHVGVAQGVRERVRQAPPQMADAAVGAGIFILGLVLLFLPGDNTFVPSPQRALAIAVLAIEALAVAFRRKHLVIATVLVVLTSLTGIFTGNESWGTLLSQLIILYTLSERCGLAISICALAAQQVLSVVSMLFAGRIPVSEIGPTIGAVADVNLPYSALVVFAGRAQARRRALAGDLERTAGELREERERLARGAIAAERSRIGRELRDIVVRSVEWMRGQAGIVRSQLASNGDRASELIGDIEVAGRRALAEMRRLLQVLRAERDPTVVEELGPVVDRKVSEPDVPSASRSPTDDAVSLSRRVLRAATIPWVTDLLIVLVMAILF